MNYIWDGYMGIKLIAGYAVLEIPLNIFLEDLKDFFFRLKTLKIQLDAYIPSARLK